MALFDFGQIFEGLLKKQVFLSQHFKKLPSVITCLRVVRNLDLVLQSVDLQFCLNLGGINLSILRFELLNLSLRIKEIYLQGLTFDARDCLGRESRLGLLLKYEVL